MNKLSIFICFMVLTVSVFAADPVTITISDGTETRKINLNADQTDFLYEVMNNMKAHQYKLDDKIDPIIVSGFTELQQVRKVIIEILRGIADQANRRVEMKQADQDANDYEPGF